MNGRQGFIIVSALLLASIGGYFLIKKYHKSETDPGSPKPDETKSKDIKSILFVGDSNTEAAWSYADKIKKKFPNIEVKKLAKHSMKTDWMYNELVKELANKSYDVIAILGGSNDIYATGKNDSAKTYLTKMYELAKSKGAKVVAVTPPNKNFYVNKTEPKQKSMFDLNTWIAGNPLKDYFIDFWNISNNIKFFTKADGYLHPQSAAHDILTTEFINKLNLK